MTTARTTKAAVSALIVGFLAAFSLTTVKPGIAWAQSGSDAKAGSGRQRAAAFGASGPRDGRISEREFGEPLRGAGPVAFYSQPPNQAFAFFSDPSCSPLPPLFGTQCTSGGQAVADNFTVAQRSRLEAVRFWGGYAPSNNAGTDNFTIIIHANNAGLPGAAVYSESGVAVSRALTGLAPFGLQEWVFNATLASPVTIESGTVYWIEIFNSPSTDNWGIETGNGPANGADVATEAPGVNWSAIPSSNDLAFELFGVDNPDCNGNGVDDDEDIATGASADCNENGVPDECDIAGGASEDCNANGLPDECEAAVGSSDLVITLRSGNGAGPADTDITMLPGPAESGFGSAFTAADFANARSGPGALFSSRHSSWIIALSTDPAARWISTSTSGSFEGASVLYAMDFDIPAGSAAAAARLEMTYAVDNSVGGPPNAGVFINELPVSGTIPAGGFTFESSFVRDDIAPMLLPGANTLYVYQRDLGGPAGIMFSARITLFSVDCNANGVPDTCDVADETSADCNSTGTPDECDVADGTSEDVNTNNIPDECECFGGAAGFVAACEATTLTLPSVPGDGLFIELFNGIGGGVAPTPAALLGRTPDGTTLSPVIDFPRPGSIVNVGQNFNLFFADTTIPPNQVSGLSATNFTLRITTLLRVTSSLDRNTGTPEINIRLGVGSDDGFHLTVGSSFLGQTGDRGFTYSWFDVVFEDEGLYPLTLLFAANAVGQSGLEFAWDVAGAGIQIIPQSNLYLSAATCEQKIEFEELPADTLLTDQYRDLGVEFNVLGGDLQITDAFPTEFVPVTGDRVFGDPNANPVDEGVVELNFVVPDTTIPAGTNFFSCFVIDAETTGASITAYDAQDNVVFADTYNAGGATQQLVEIAAPYMRRIVITLGQGGDTAALDSICFNVPVIRDCNSNGTADELDISGGGSDDCNLNDVPDECDLASGASTDCNTNQVPDECETDCNVNDVPDDCDITSGTSGDCNANGVPDDCEIASGASTDCNTNAIPDECETDCNGNGIPDDCDIEAGTSVDCTANGIPDECEPDCDGDLIADSCELLAGTSVDCNGNGVPDECDLTSGASEDCNTNAIPDECDISSSLSVDCDADGIPDECELSGGSGQDCNGNGVLDNCDVSSGFSTDADGNGVPDECQDFADLVVTQVTAPASGVTRGVISVSWTVQNLGDGPATGTWRDTVYLSGDAAAGGDIPLASFDFTGPIVPTGVYSRTQNVTLPAGVSGDHYVVVVTDTLNAVFELNAGGDAEVNNARVSSSATTVLQPDLVISNPSAPSAAHAGQQISVGWTVTNAGAGAANPNWSDCVFLSSDDQVGGDAQLGCQLRSTVLAGGNFYNALLAVTVPTNTAAGDHWFVIRADHNNALDESSSVNNDVVIGPVTVSRANLTLSPSLGVPAEGYTGQQVPVSWTVTNTGAVPAEGSWSDCAYLSPDDQIDGDEVLMGCIANPVNLSPGAHYDRAAGFTVPGVMPGNYWLVVRTNNGCSSFGETDCGDNEAIAGPFPVYVTPCPDLSAGNVVVSATTVPAGGMLFVDWQVTNVGTGATTVPFWKDQVYLSTDQSVGADTALNPLVNNPQALNVSEGYQQSVEVSIPSNVFGTFYVLVRTDAQGAMGECAEGNNAAFSAVTIEVEQFIPPTLSAINCQVSPPDPLPGDPVTVTWSLTNNGEVATGPFNITHNLYFSVDDVFNNPPADTLLVAGVGPLMNNLDPGEVVGPFVAMTNVPLGQRGAHHVIVRPDAGGGSGLMRENCAAAVTVQDGLPADLEFDDMQVPATGYSGQPLAMSWTVRNAAIESTLSNFWNDRVYLSVDNDLATTGDNTLLGTFPHYGALDFAESYTGPEFGLVTLPNGANGSYFVFVQIDADDHVFEGSFENNNLASDGPISVTFAPADIEVTDVTVRDAFGVAVSSAQSNTTVMIDWMVENTGAGHATGSWSDRVYLSSDGVLNVGGDLLVATAVHSGGLTAGDAYAALTSAYIPLDLFGPNVHAFVCADALGSAFESDEGNNCTAVGPINVTFGPPDLRVLSASLNVNGLPVSSVTSGTSVTMRWTVVNDDIGATVQNSWNDRVYLSADPFVDAGDLLIANKPHSGLLLAGETYTSAQSFEMPIELGDTTVYVLVAVDSPGVVVERDDGNNTGASQQLDVAWGPADLTVDSVSVSGAPVAGGMMTVDWTVRNTGGPTQSGGWSDAVYLSTDRFLSAGDTLLDTVARSGDLDYNEPYPASTSVTLPLDVTGNRYLLVVTDDGDAEPEADEADNVRDRLITIAPDPADLQVTLVDAPATALSGQSMQVSWTVANFGIGATNDSTWFDAVYLSPDQFLDRTTDTYLGFFTHSGVLDAAGGANDDYAQTQSVSLPNGLSGPRYLFIVTDSNNRVVEANAGGDAEDNNEGLDATAVVVEIPPPSDVVVTGITVPPTGTLGESIAIQWSVRNDGAFDAQGSWHDAVYVSADTTWDAGDRKIGHVQRTGPLAPASSYMASLNGLVPGVVPGDYHVIVRADIFNEVRESAAGETNNAAASAGLTALDAFVLTLNVPEGSHSLEAGASRFYKIPNVQPGDDVLVTLDSASETMLTELYISRGQVPDRGHFDFAFTAPFQPDQAVLVPQAAGGTYYVLAHANSGGPSGYVIEAALLDFKIIDVAPRVINNAGPVTLQVRGAKFTPATTFELSGLGGSIPAGRVYFENASLVFATFDLAGQPLGPYDLSATQSPGGNTADLTDAVEVTEGPGGQLAGRIVGFDRVRPGVDATMEVRYANVGKGDLQAPLVIVSTATSTLFGFSPDRYVTDSVRLLGIPPTGPVGLLRAGQSESVFLQFRSVAGPMEFRLRLVQSDNTELIDYVAMEAQLRPSGLSDGVWNAAYARFQAMIDGHDAVPGGTYGELVTALGATAERLGGRGLRVGSADALIRQMLNTALEFTPSAIKGTMLDEDMSMPAAGSIVLASPVNATNMPTGDRPGFARIKPDGSFVIHNVAPGRYEIGVAGYTLGPPMYVEVTADTDLDLLVGGVKRRGSALRGGGNPFPGYPQGAGQGGWGGDDDLRGPQLQGDLGRLAQDTYNPNTNVPAGYNYLTTVTDPSTGLSWSAYQNTNTGDLAISFRGTEASVQDALADLDLTALQWNNSNRQQVFDYVNNYLGDNPGAGVNFTGHSLGGGLAQFAAYDFRGNPANDGVDMTLTSFNGVGVADRITQRDGSYNPNQLSGDGIWHYIVNGDLVSLLGGGHVGGEMGGERNTYLLGDSELFFLTAHGIGTLLGLGPLPTDPGSAFAPPYLQNLEHARQFLKAYACFGQLVPDEAGPVEAAARLIAALSKLKDADPAALDELIGFLAMNLLNSGTISQEVHDFIFETDWATLMDVLDIFLPVSEAAAGLGALVDVLGQIALVVAIIDDAIDLGVIAAEAVIDAIVDAAEAAADFVEDLVEAAIDTAQDIADAVGDFVSDTADAIGDLIDDAGDFLGEQLSNLGDLLGDLGDFIADNFNPFDWIPGGGLLDDIVGGLLDFFSPQFIRASDPNDILGPAGFGEQHWVTADEDLPYTIRFENMSIATAPAAQVVVTHVLDTDLDARTVQLGEVGFGDNRFTVPAGRAFFNNTMPFGTDGLAARLIAGLNLATGTVTWELTALDPATGELPEDGSIGLLPPNDPEVHDGEGFVSFKVRARRNVPTGSEAVSEAVIIFDTNEPIPTNQVFVTIDNDDPASAVDPLPAETATSAIDLTWSGNDGTDESGLNATFEIYASIQGAPYFLWRTTTDTAAVFTGGLGGTGYRFYSIARDNAGNVEAPPPAPDAVTAVAPQTPPTPALDSFTANSARLVGLGAVNAAAVEHAVYLEAVDGSAQGYLTAAGTLSASPVWRPQSAWINLQIQGLTPRTFYLVRAKARSGLSETPFGPDAAFATLTMTGQSFGACCRDGACVEVPESECLPCNVSNTCFADVDNNGEVNPGDRGFISANIGQIAPSLLCQFDLDGNGVINPGDRGMVSANLGLCTPPPAYQRETFTGTFRGHGSSCVDAPCP